MSKRTSAAGALLLIFAAAAAWESSGTSSLSLLVSRPSLIATYVFGHPADVFRALITTGIEAACGVLVAFLLSLLVSPLFILYPRAAAVIYPWLVFSQIIPLVALAPLVIVIFGFGISGKIALSALMGFFPILANILAGVRSMPRAALATLHMMNAAWHHRLQVGYVPHCLPFLFSGLRVATPITVIGAIVAEFNGAAHGVGKDIFIAAKRLEPELMMTGIVSGALLGALLYAVVVASEKAIGPWYNRS